MSGQEKGFLLEIGCEEIPARMIGGAVADLAEGAVRVLDAARLPHGESRVFSTPRRLAIQVRDVAPRQQDRDEELLGPPARAAFGADGKPTKAAAGFAQKMGVEVARLMTIATPKGDYLGLRRRVPGRTAREVLAEGIPRIVAGMTFPKMMRWGDGTRRFVRPVHWVVALLGEEVVPFELFGVDSGRQSTGHRILGARAVRIASAAEYESALLAQGAVADRAARRTAIARRLDELAATEGVEPVEDGDLLDEIVDLVEHPGAVLGSFPEEFLSLPREVLVTTLRHHQKAHSTEAEGKLANRFLVVADTDKDPAGHIRRGNEWVIVGRLEDAKFFYQEDRKIPFVERREKLKQITFHAKAGTYADKSRRIGEIARALAETIRASTGAHDAGVRSIDLDCLRQASALAKCDLTTGLVGEFPELQGIAGGLYMRAEVVEGRASFPPGAADAVYDQYRPSGADDAIPRTLEGSLLALADRLDTLMALGRCVGLPSGSRDPFGLRRGAYAAIRIVAETPFPLSLGQMVEAAQAAVEPNVSQNQDGAGAGEILVFLLDRLQFWLKERSASYDTINAVLRARRDPQASPTGALEAVVLAASGARAPFETVPRLAEKALTLERMRELPDFAALVEIHKRCRNILEQSEGTGAGHSLDVRVKVDPVEAPTLERLTAQVDDAERGVALSMQRDDFEAALQRLVGLRPALSDFFDHVLVMHPDAATRTVRLALVRRTAVMIEEVADLKQISISRDELQKRLGQLSAS